MSIHVSVQRHTNAEPNEMEGRWRMRGLEKDGSSCCAIPDRTRKKNLFPRVIRSMNCPGAAVCILSWREWVRVGYV